MIYKIKNEKTELFYKGNFRWGTVGRVWHRRSDIIMILNLLNTHNPSKWASTWKPKVNMDDIKVHFTEPERWHKETAEYFKIPEKKRTMRQMVENSLNRETIVS